MKEQIVYYHEVQYYETDAMRVVHHSNYIRWFEECRTAFLKQVELDYDKLEERGLIIPVLSVDCEYKQSVVFGQKVKVLAKLDYFTGLRFGLSYEVYSEDGTVLHAKGATTHCFLNAQMRPLNIKKHATDVYERFVECLPQENNSIA